MTDRKKKAIDYLNDPKVKKDWGEFFLILGLIIIGIVLGIFAIIEIIK